MPDSNDTGAPFEQSPRARRLENKSAPRRLASYAASRLIDRPSIGGRRRVGRGRDINVPTAGTPGTRTPTGSNFDPDRDGWVDEGTTRPRFIGVGGRPEQTPDSDAAKFQTASSVLSSGSGSKKLSIVNDDDERVKEFFTFFDRGTGEYALPDRKNPPKLSNEIRDLDLYERYDRGRFNPYRFVEFLDDKNQKQLYLIINETSGNSVIAYNASRLVDIAKTWRNSSPNFFPSLFSLSDYRNERNSKGILFQNAIVAVMHASKPLKSYSSNYKNNGKGWEIYGVEVKKPHRRRGIASALLKMHRDTWPELGLDHSSALSEDGKGFAEATPIESLSSGARLSSGEKSRLFEATNYVQRIRYALSRYDEDGYWPGRNFGVVIGIGSPLDESIDDPSASAKNLTREKIIELIKSEIPNYDELSQEEAEKAVSDGLAGFRKRIEDKLLLAEKELQRVLFFENRRKAASSRTLIDFDDITEEQYRQLEIESDEIRALSPEALSRRFRSAEEGKTYLLSVGPDLVRVFDKIKTTDDDGGKSSADAIKTRIENVGKGIESAQQLLNLITSGADTLPRNSSLSGAAAKLGSRIDLRGADRIKISDLPFSAAALAEQLNQTIEKNKKTISELSEQLKLIETTSGKNFSALIVESSVITPPPGGYFRNMSLSHLIPSEIADIPESDSSGELPTGSPRGKIIDPYMYQRWENSFTGNIYIIKASDDQFVDEPNKRLKKRIVSPVSPIVQISLPIARSAQDSPRLSKILPAIVARIIDASNDRRPLTANRILGDSSKPLSSGYVYRGMHEAPDRTSGAPINDLTDIYPDDIYDSEALSLYSSGYENLDSTALSIIRSLKDKPEATVRIYRAVPSSNSKKLEKLLSQKRYMQRYGKVPPGARTYLDRSEYYERISQEIERLSNLPKEKLDRKINPGDWITITRGYAKLHGETNLLDGFEIISARVKAKDIYTNGDSLQEWGYDPEDGRPASLSSGKKMEMPESQRRKLQEHRNSNYKYGDRNVFLSEDGREVLVRSDRRDWLKGMTPAQIAQLVVPSTKEEYIDLMADMYIPELKSSPFIKSLLPTIRGAKMFDEALRREARKMAEKRWAKTIGRYGGGEAERQTERWQSMIRSAREAVQRSLEESPSFRWAAETFGFPPIVPAADDGNTDRKWLTKGVAGAFTMGTVFINEQNLDRFEQLGIPWDGSIGTRSVFDNSVQSSIRHEYAHWLQQRMLTSRLYSTDSSDSPLFALGLNESQVRDAIDIAREFRRNTRDDERASVRGELTDSERSQAFATGGSRPISSYDDKMFVATDYGNTNHDEMLAEAFAAIFHPDPDFRNKALTPGLIKKVAQFVGIWDSERNSIRTPWVESIEAVDAQVSLRSGLRASSELREQRKRDAIGQISRLREGGRQGRALSSGRYITNEYWGDLSEKLTRMAERIDTAPGGDSPVNSDEIIDAVETASRLIERFDSTYSENEIFIDKDFILTAGDLIDNIREGLVSSGQISRYIESQKDTDSAARGLYAYLISSILRGVASSGNGIDEVFSDSSFEGMGEQQILDLLDSPPGKNTEKILRFASHVKSQIKSRIDSSMSYLISFNEERPDVDKIEINFEVLSSLSPTLDALDKILDTSERIARTIINEPEVFGGIDGLLRTSGTANMPSETLESIRESVSRSIARRKASSARSFEKNKLAGKLHEEFDSINLERFMEMDKDEASEFVAKAFSHDSIIGNNGKKYSTKIQKIVVNDSPKDKTGDYGKRSVSVSIEIFDIDGKPDGLPSSASAGEDQDSEIPLKSVGTARYKIEVMNSASQRFGGDNYILLDDISISYKENRSVGIIGQINQQAFEYAKRVGIDYAVILDAAADGSYVWGKVGFMPFNQPSDPPWEESLAQLVRMYRSGMPSLVDEESLPRVLALIDASRADRYITHADVSVALERPGDAKHNRLVKTYVSDSTPFNGGWLPIGSTLRPPNLSDAIQDYYYDDYDRIQYPLSSILSSGRTKIKPDEEKLKTIHKADDVVEAAVLLDDSFPDGVESTLRRIQVAGTRDVDYSSVTPEMGIIRELTAEESSIQSKVLETGRLISDAADVEAYASIYGISKENAAKIVATMNRVESLRFKMVENGMKNKEIVARAVQGNFAGRNNNFGYLSYANAPRTDSLVEPDFAYDILAEIRTAAQAAGDVPAKSLSVPLAEELEQIEALQKRLRDLGMDDLAGKNPRVLMFDFKLPDDINEMFGIMKDEKSGMQMLLYAPNSNSAIVHDLIKAIEIADHQLSWAQNLMFLENRSPKEVMYLMRGKTAEWAAINHRYRSDERVAASMSDDDLQKIVFRMVKGVLNSEDVSAAYSEIQKSPTVNAYIPDGKIPGLKEGMTPRQLRELIPYLPGMLAESYGSKKKPTTGEIARSRQKALKFTLEALGVEFGSLEEKLDSVKIKFSQKYLDAIQVAPGSDEERLATKEIIEKLVAPILDMIPMSMFDGSMHQQISTFDASSDEFSPRADAVNIGPRTEMSMAMTNGSPLVIEIVPLSSLNERAGAVLEFEPDGSPVARIYTPAFNVGSPVSAIPDVSQMGGKGMDAIVAHEVGHGLEFFNPWIRALERLEWISRSGNEPAELLSRLYPGHKYDDSEVAVKDYWINPYIGKLYKIGDKHGSNSHWEIMSMGMENLLAGEYADGRHRSFIIGVLAAASRSNSRINSDQPRPEESRPRGEQGLFSRIRATLSSGLNKNNERVNAAEQKVLGLEKAIRDFEETGNWNGADYGVVKKLVETTLGFDDEIDPPVEPVNLTADEISARGLDPQEILGEAKLKLEIAKSELELQKKIAERKAVRVSQGTIDLEDIPDDVLADLTKESEELEKLRNSNPAEHLRVMSPENPSEMAVRHAGAAELDGGVLDPGKTRGAGSYAGAVGDTQALNTNEIKEIKEKIQNSEQFIKNSEKLVEKLRKGGVFKIESEFEREQLGPLFRSFSALDGVDQIDVNAPVRRFTGRWADLPGGGREQIFEDFSIAENISSIARDLERRISENNDSLSRLNRMMERINESPKGGYLSAYPLSESWATRAAGYGARYDMTDAPPGTPRQMSRRWRQLNRGSVYVFIGEKDRDVTNMLGPQNEAQIIGINKPLIGISYRAEDDKYKIDNVLAAVYARVIRLHNSGQDVTWESVLGGGGNRSTDAFGESATSLSSGRTTVQKLADGPQVLTNGKDEYGLPKMRSLEESERYFGTTRSEIQQHFASKYGIAIKLNKSFDGYDDEKFRPEDRSAVYGALQAIEDVLENIPEISERVGKNSFTISLPNDYRPGESRTLGSFDVMTRIARARRLNLESRQRYAIRLNIASIAMHADNLASESLSRNWRREMANNRYNGVIADLFARLGIEGFDAGIFGSGSETPSYDDPRVKKLIGDISHRIAYGTMVHELTHLLDFEFRDETDESMPSGVSMAISRFVMGRDEDVLRESLSRAQFSATEQNSGALSAPSVSGYGVTTPMERLAEAFSAWFMFAGAKNLTIKPAVQRSPDSPTVAGSDRDMSEVLGPLVTPFLDRLGPAIKSDNAETNRTSIELERVPVLVDIFAILPILIDAQRKKKKAKRPK